MPRRRKRKRDPKKSKSGYKPARGARGKVWVPVLTQAEVTERHQYWNKVKMTKDDALFREMEEKFTKLALKERHVEYSASDLNRQRNFGISTIVRPYPSGSCHTIMAGDSSAFCSKPTLHWK